MIMKAYKVEFEKVNKHYARVTVHAENRKQALALARDMKEEDFEETESIQAVQWNVKKVWSIWDLFIG